MKNQQTRNYRVQLELKSVFDELKSIGIKQALKGPYWIKVQGTDPDDACHLAMKKIKATLCMKAGQKFSVEISEVLERYMRVIKLICL
jgi:hypothetical protein